MYEVQVIKGRGETRSKAATCTKYIAASCKPFSFGPAPAARAILGAWGASNADHAKPIHPTKPLYIPTLLLPRDLFGAHSKDILRTSTRTKVLACCVC